MGEVCSQPPAASSILQRAPAGSCGLQRAPAANLGKELAIAPNPSELAGLLRRRFNDIKITSSALLCSARLIIGLSWAGLRWAGLGRAQVTADLRRRAEPRRNRKPKTAGGEKRGEIEIFVVRRPVYGRCWHHCRSVGWVECRAPCRAREENVRWTPRTGRTAHAHRLAVTSSVGDPADPESSESGCGQVGNTQPRCAAHAQVCSIATK